MPIAAQAERGDRLTRRAGIHAITIAEDLLRGMPTLALGCREVVRTQFDRVILAGPATAGTEALGARRIAVAFPGVSDLGPLPALHPLWSLDPAHVSGHLSGDPARGY
jgi:hypothetical protein